MTHTQLLKQLKPKITMEISVKHKSTDVLYFNYQYGIEFMTIENKHIRVDVIKVPRFATLIALRSVAAKWLIDNGYNQS